MAQLPLSLFADGAKFRLPGKRKTYTKLHNWGSPTAIPIFDTTGRQIDSERHARALCKNSSGKRLEIRLDLWVEEV